VLTTELRVLESRKAGLLGSWDLGFQNWKPACIGFL
jgi:hypothetical protein